MNFSIFEGYFTCHEKTSLYFEKVFKTDTVIKCQMEELQDIPVEPIELWTERTGRE